MHFVNRHGLIEGVALTARCHPFLVAPLIIEIPHDGRRLWRYLIENRKRIRFIYSVVVKAGNNVILVKCPITDFGEKPFPDPRLCPGLERVAALVPVVKIAHDKNLRGIGCPDRKLSTTYTFVVDHMSAQFVVESEMAALVKKVEILIG